MTLPATDPSPFEDDEHGEPVLIEYHPTRNRVRSVVTRRGDEFVEWHFVRSRANDCTYAVKGDTDPASGPLCLLPEEGPRSSAPPVRFWSAPGLALVQEPASVAHRADQRATARAAGLRLAPRR